MKKFIAFVFGWLLGFAVSTFVTKSIEVGFVGGIIVAFIFSSLVKPAGKAAVEAEYDALGEKSGSRSTLKAILLWFVLFCIGAAALLAAGVRF